MWRSAWLVCAVLVLVDVAAGEETAPRLGKIVTVRGVIDPLELGRTLTHEHVLVDFVGAKFVSKNRYNRSEVVEMMLPHLADLRERGFDALVECTPAWLGRDPVLLRELSEKSGLHLLTNTGYYPVGGGRHLPSHPLRGTRPAGERWLAGLQGSP